MKKSILLEKTYAFSLLIIQISDQLNTQKVYALSNQILRSGTSIGANCEEANGAQSSKDFVAKLSIAYKEARETKYWLRLLKDTKKIEDKMATQMLQSIEDILRILYRSIQTTKNKP